MKPVALGFTGTSHGTTRAQVTTLIGWLLPRAPFIVAAHHGDCVDADDRFDLLCFALEIPRVIHPPLIDAKRAFCERRDYWGPAPIVLEPGPHLWRNHQIVDATGALVAMPRGPEELRSGTWATVRYARKLGRPIRFFWPDGSSTVERFSASAAPAEPPRP